MFRHTVTIYFFSMMGLIGPGSGKSLCGLESRPSRRSPAAVPPAWFRAVEGAAEAMIRELMIPENAFEAMATVRDKRYDFSDTLKF
jgi:hypothetical protein